MKDFTNENIIHVKDGRVEYLKFRILEKYSHKLNHCFALRHGGVSKGLYSSLNFRTAGKDSKQNIIQNLDILCKSIEVNPNDVYKAHQYHTDRVEIINNQNKEKYRFHKFCVEDIDGYITNQKNIATLITTADCNPIILYDPIKNVVSNVHSGWKGTVKQIYLKAAMKMHDVFNCSYKDIIVCVGPSIKKCCWLSQDLKLKELFKTIWPYTNEYIENKENGYFGVDFPYVIKKDLIDLGLVRDNIVLSNICTCCNADSFFSYRYTTQNHQAEYGTEATITELI